MLHKRPLSADGSGAADGAPEVKRSPRPLEARTRHCSDGLDAADVDAEDDEEEEAASDMRVMNTPTDEDEAAEELGRLRESKRNLKLLLLQQQQQNSSGRGDGGADETQRPRSAQNPNNLESGKDKWL